MSDLESALTAELARYKRFARHNYRAAYVLSAVAVLASILAGLSVAGQWFSRTTLAVLSALPGAVLVIFDRFQFERKAAWHWRKAYALQALLQRLRFEGQAPSDVSAEWRRLNEELDGIWPSFGRPPANDNDRALPARSARSSLDSHPY